MVTARPSDLFGSGDPPLAGRSFAAVVTTGTALADTPLGIGVVSTYRGESARHLSRQELVSLVEPFQNMLVRHFSFNKPPMEVIRKFFVSLGLKGKCIVGLLDPNHILIRPML